MNFKIKDNKIVETVERNYDRKYYTRQVEKWTAKENNARKTREEFEAKLVEIDKLLNK